MKGSLFKFKPANVKEGFFCKKVAKCRANKTGFRKSPDWSWLGYVVPVLFIIVLFFLLPKEEEWIALVVLGAFILVLICIGIYKWIKSKSCKGACFSNKEMSQPAISEATFEKVVDKEFKEEITKIKRGEKRLEECPGPAFNPKKEPPDSAPIAGYNYDQCIKNGFSLDFCVETPLFRMGPGTCRCYNGKIGFIDPKNPASCDCP